MTAKKADRQIPSPWIPEQWDIADAGAIQACLRGEAEPHQQQRAIRFIVESICGTYDLSYRPGGEEGRRNTDFAEGKRFVGTRIVTLSKLNLTKFKEKKA